MYFAFANQNKVNKQTCRSCNCKNNIDKHPIMGLQTEFTESNSHSTQW